MTTGLRLAALIRNTLLVGALAFTALSVQASPAAANETICGERGRDGAP
ncbi:hypothetical protein ACWFR5_13795 [Streptomyces sp. NPDC055092]